MEHEISQDKLVAIKQYVNTMSDVSDCSGISKQKREELFLVILKRVYVGGLNDGVALTLNIIQK